MFGLFKKKKEYSTTDKVWMDEPNKEIGFVEDLFESIGSSKQHFILYFFDDSKANLERLLNAQNIVYEDNEVGDSSAQIIIMSAANLPYDQALLKIVDAELVKENAEFIFFEHHPSHTKDEEVLEFISGLTENYLKFKYYISLDDPLMQLFGSDRIKEIMVRMGYKDGECIEHRSITSSIERAQKKVEDNRLSDVRASSSKEWIEVNLQQTI